MIPGRRLRATCMIDPQCRQNCGSSSSGFPDAFSHAMQSVAFGKASIRSFAIGRPHRVQGRVSSQAASSWAAALSRADVGRTWSPCEWQRSQDQVEAEWVSSGRTISADCSSLRRKNPRSRRRAMAVSRSRISRFEQAGQRRSNRGCSATGGLVGLGRCFPERSPQGKLCSRGLAA